jgi:hypothetical protein
MGFPPARLGYGHDQYTRIPPARLQGSQEEGFWFLKGLYLEHFFNIKSG